jgi:hypothetical protein
MQSERQSDPRSYKRKKVIELDGVKEYKKRIKKEH